MIHPNRFRCLQNLFNKPSDYLLYRQTKSRTLFASGCLKCSNTTILNTNAMGVDIHVGAEPNIFENDYMKFQNRYRLSRQFCWLITDFKDGQESELTQLAKITNTDISPLIKMCDYPPELPPDRYRFLYGEPQETEAQVMARIRQKKKASQQSLDTIELLVHKLLLGLTNQPRFYEDIKYVNQNKFWLKVYFRDIENDTVNQNFQDNNLGQDLRNFFNTIEYVREKRGEFVYFKFL